MVSSCRTPTIAVLRRLVCAALTVATGACTASTAGPARTPDGAPQPATSFVPPPADAPRTPVPVSPDPLDVSPAAEAFARSPKLRAKLAKSPYTYFRFINAAFSQIVCTELADFGGSAPSVPLHGDAHLEQYALTDIGRGLTDFDDAATGPAVVDLARMTTSLVLAARLRGWSEDGPVRAFLDGYRAGLGGASAPRPSVMTALRTRFENAPAKFLDGAGALMLPENADPTLDGDEMRLAVMSLEKETRAGRADLPGHFFHVKKIGTFKAGIGSALERKFLVRVEGPSAETDDDRIVEVKFVGDRTRPSCIRSRYDFDQRDLREDVPPGSLDRFLDPTFIRDKNAWAQEWYPNFHEVQVADLPDEKALDEVARDAGALLAREHVRGASPSSLALDDVREKRLRAAALSLADRVESSWTRFRSKLPGSAEASPPAQVSATSTPTAAARAEPPGGASGE